MFRPIAALGALALLAACATPQERCIANANKQLTTLRALIAETEQNIARGYAIETQQTVRTSIQLCAGAGSRSTDLLLCQMAEPREKRVPVTIDTDLEKRKLAQMKAREVELSRALPAAYDTCERAYPQ